MSTVTPSAKPGTGRFMAGSPSNRRLGGTSTAGASIAVSGTLQQMLFEISGTDPFTLASVRALLVLVAVIASWVPAFRAARLGPVEALRAE
jgi:ABC-type Fe3+-siderophore transport system permease subunit